MPVNLEYTNFDKGLYLLGGRAEMPQGTMRVATATNPIHTGSVRSRNGSTQVVSGIEMVSVFRFYQTRVGIDHNGGFWWVPDPADGVTTAWQANHTYSAGAIILDSNGNWQIVTTGGTSGSSHPSWGVTPLTTTADNTVVWTWYGGVQTGSFSFGTGERVTFTKAPPQIGDAAYLFISGCGSVKKVDKNGSITNWGIVAPSNGMTAVIGDLNSTPIDQMKATTGWTIANTGSGISTVTTDNSFYIIPSASLKLSLAPSTTTRLSKNITIDLTAFTQVTASSYLQDIISFYVAIDQPYLVDYLAIVFSLGDTTFQNSFGKKVTIKPARNTVPNALGMQDVLNLDNAVAGQTNLSNVYYNPTANKIAVAPGERIRKHDILYNVDGGISNHLEWNLWHLVKESFQRNGTNTTLGWKDVQAVRFRIANKSPSVSPTVWLTDLFMSGGTGMVGTYQYLVAFQNTNTGTLSNANPTPIVVQNVNRQTVSVGSIPVSTDPQVNARVILRTVGNGGYFYQDDVIDDNTTTSYTDDVSDFFGLNGGTDPVGDSSAGNPSEPTLTGNIFAFVNVPPAATYQFSTVWQGTMFWCGDTATGCRGRLYYSTIGNSEGVASFTDLTNDDDPTQNLVVWNNQLYLFTTKAVYSIYQANDPNVVVNPSYPIPLFSGNQVTGCPGTTAPFSIVATPEGVMYQTNEGELGLMNGLGFQPVAPQILQLLRGESVEGYSAIGAIVAATYGKLEYMFSDGTQTFALNMQDNAVRSVGIPLTALYFEPDTGYFSASNATLGWFLLEQSGVYADCGNAISFTVQCPSGYVNTEKYIGSVRYVLIDANLNSQSLTPTLLLDNNSIALNNSSAITGTGRQVYELTSNQEGRIAAVSLTGSLTAQVEIFRIAFDQEPMGNTDDSTSSFEYGIGSGVFNTESGGSGG